MPLPVLDEQDARLVSIQTAGLMYVNDALAGIRRRRHADGFRYVMPDGSRVRDPEDLVRIKDLVIPPAWEDVWISPLANGHIQAVGRDARGRKQYIYHADWRKVRDETKFERMSTFARLLPQLRERVDKDMSRPGLAKQRVLATVVRLLDLSLIRVGNREYERANHTYGLTTLKQGHVDVQGSEVRFEFQGKRGVRHNVGVRDRRLARDIARLQELPGQELFHYLDEDGEPQRVDSQDVNDYIREAIGEEFTAKDFRTLSGTVLAAMALKELGPCESKTQGKRNVAKALDVVAERLRNTRAVCRKSYVNPLVIDAYLEGFLCRELDDQIGQEGTDGLLPEEVLVLRFLERRNGYFRESDCRGWLVEGKLKAVQLAISSRGVP